jgi:hypothetical protein
VKYFHRFIVERLWRAPISIQLHAFAASSMIATVSIRYRDDGVRCRPGGQIWTTMMALVGVILSATCATSIVQVGDRYPSTESRRHERIAAAQEMIV